ncbi:hypothetical protein BN946_scf184788.g16 [Trametes cinnabarina]|uniref:PCI domain-containing protein n=1 Tax=Pycnoporus cinnabarinus TaxID=5643 RepID=A0A060S1C4_PYCCI|nr:hypothetical protein BN946_scf184788.g16 [Trametes cinnabarina]
MAAPMAVDKAKAPKIDVDEFLTLAISETPAELHPFFESFRSLYSRKLWHQLTNKLFEFFDHPLSKPYRVDVFNKFVRDFGLRLNQLRLVEMGVKVSKEIDNPVTHLQFLTDLLERVNIEKSPEAHVLLLSSLAHAKLLYGDHEGTKNDIDAAWKVLDELSSVDPSVNAAYYGVAADYYKSKAEYAPYYKNSLLYLACIDPAKDLTAEERLLRAHDLGIAAFLGDTIYNFGELPILQENYPFLRQKICLMALIESVFKRGSYDRTMSFQTIAEETHLPLDEVEHLVMKALSLKLIKGSLDQVDQKAQITWVQPRVLSREQIGQLAQRLAAWNSKLHQVEERIAPEVLVNS